MQQKPSRGEIELAVVCRNSEEEPLGGAAVTGSLPFMAQHVLVEFQTFR